jgi:hypothetical protein
MNQDIFISYSSKDSYIVEKVVDMFKNKNISYWFAPEQLIGKKHDEAIVPAIKNCKIFLIFLSKNSRPRDGLETSQWVRDELLTAREYKSCIQPIKLDQTVDLETNNLMYKALPNYFDITNGNLNTNLNVFETIITTLLLNDNYKKSKIETLLIFEDKQKIIISDIEENLKNGFIELAEKRIDENIVIDNRYKQNILLLKCIILMSKIPIKDMNISDLKIIVNILHSLRNSKFKNISYYLESMISKSYFSFNAIKNNISEEYTLLKQLSKNESRIRSKYYLMSRQIQNIISAEEYEIAWI